MRQSIVRPVHGDPAALPVAEAPAKPVEVGSVYFDAAEKDAIDYMTISAEDGKHLESLIELESHGTMSALAHLEIDLESTVATAENMPNSQIARMTAGQRKTLEDLVRGYKFSFTATGEGDSIVFSTVISEAFVAKVLAFLQQGPGKGQDLAL